MSRIISQTINCTSYSEEDGCTNDTYVFEINIDTGCVSIRHEISCGLIGHALFSAPSSVSNYGVPIPEYIVHMINMVLVDNDFKTEPKHKSAAIEKFILWLDSAMKHEVRSFVKIEQLKKDNDELEKEMESEYQSNKSFMDMNISLLSSLVYK